MTGPATSCAAPSQPPTHQKHIAWPQSTTIGLHRSSRHMEQRNCSRARCWSVSLVMALRASWPAHGRVERVASAEDQMHFQ